MHALHKIFKFSAIIRKSLIFLFFFWTTVIFHICCSILCGFKMLLRNFSLASFNVDIMYGISFLVGIAGIPHEHLTICVRGWVRTVFIALMKRVASWWGFVIMCSWNGKFDAHSVCNICLLTIHHNIYYNYMFGCSESSIA